MSPSTTTTVQVHLSSGVHELTVRKDEVESLRRELRAAWAADNLGAVLTIGKLEGGEWMIRADAVEAIEFFEQY